MSHCQYRVGNQYYLTASCLLISFVLTHSFSHMASDCSLGIDVTVGKSHPIGLIDCTLSSVKKKQAGFG